MRKFPHLTGAPEFPGAGREVYEQIPGSFDYAEWGEGATVTLLAVPWGVYDPETQTDVPGFDTARERDAWFDSYIKTHAAESHTLKTYVRYQLKGYVELPFTFDATSRYNYMVVDYDPAPVDNSGSPFARWFFHISDVDYDSANCTRAFIDVDWWVTCAPLMEINHMILARGHAPVAATSVDVYLSDPVSNSAYLLAPDVDFGGAERVAHSDDVVFNSGEMFAVVCTRGVDLTGDFSGYGMAATASVSFTDGQLSSWQCAVRAVDLGTLLSNMHSEAPQACENVECVFLAGEKLISMGAEVTVFGVRAWLAVAGRAGSVHVALDKAKFGFDSRYADLAKLYTSPYSRLEVSDERGGVAEIKIEELSGAGVSVAYAFNAAFPWLKVSACVSNAGGPTRSISFTNVTEHAFTGGGKWYRTLREWDVPCFTVTQSAAEAYGYQQHYNTQQARANADVSYTNTLASNKTGYDNAAAGNALAQTNAHNNAALMVSNNAITVAANTATTARSVDGSTSAALRANTKTQTDASADAAFASASYTADKDAIAAASASNMANAINSGVSLVANVATGAATGAAVGAAGGAAAGAGVGAVPGAAVGFIAGMATSAISYAASTSANNVSQSNNSTLYGASLTSIDAKKSNATSYTTDATATSNAVATDNTATVNEASTATTNNSADNTRVCARNTRSVADSNNTRSKDTGDANAKRSYDNACSAVQASIDNAGMQSSTVYGLARGGEFSSTRPAVLSVNVVTESAGAVAQAAAQFKRWGYALNQAFEFETWNLMRHFTYWQVSDVWATGTGVVPEAGQDAVRAMLYSGVTCWKDPAEIGKVSVYDN